jgi:UDP-2,4-diacetamido-2,4,6-trideoxy-beta-L-altropyranose hydrolase
VVLELAGGPGLGLGHLHRGLSLAQDLGAVRYALHPQARADAIAIGMDAGLILRDRDVLPDGAVVVLDTLHHGNAGQTAARIAQLRARGHPVVVIDSMPPDHLPADTPHTAPDLLITPYLNAGRLRPPPACAWLHGAEYAILHPSYRAARAQGIRGAPDAVLVACGGADPSRLSCRIAALCADSRHPVDLVIGPQFDANLVADLRAIAARAPMLRLQDGLDPILPLYQRAAVVLGRPGLLRYETACLGRTGIYLWEGAQYLEYFTAMQDSGMAEIYLGTSPGGLAAFQDRIAALLAAPDLPPVPQPRVQAIVDGLGALRVAKAVRELHKHAGNRGSHDARD